MFKIICEQECVIGSYIQSKMGSLAGLWSRLLFCTRRNIGLFKLKERSPPVKIMVVTMKKWKYARRMKTCRVDDGENAYEC